MLLALCRAPRATCPPRVSHEARVPAIYSALRRSHRGGGGSCRAGDICSEKRSAARCSVKHGAGRRSIWRHNAPVPGFLDTTRVAVTFRHAAASSSSGVQITTTHSRQCRGVAGPSRPGNYNARALNPWWTWTILQFVYSILRSVLSAKQTYIL